ncbi:hypothetical protein BDV12DRAFT_204819 [Aspergillus spectabilis]
MCLPSITLPIPLVTALPQQAYTTETWTSETALQCKEWSSLTDDQHIAYTSAINCLMNKPSIYKPDIVPGSTSYPPIHQSGIFLSWHREFLHLLESAFHGCYYPSTLGLPYWDWPLYTFASLSESPLFDGSPTLLGGNGTPAQADQNISSPLQNLTC